MAQHQLSQRAGERHIAGALMGRDPKTPSGQVSQQVNESFTHAVMKMLGGNLEDSAGMEIVNPATGHFWFQAGISQPSGGTDDPRP